MIARKAATQARERTQHSAAVAFLGPRQAGKTTPARELADERGGVYLDLMVDLFLVRRLQP